MERCQAGITITMPGTLFENFPDAARATDLDSLAKILDKGVFFLPIYGIFITVKLNVACSNEARMICQICPFRASN